jgi:hypothetical protein
MIAIPPRQEYIASILPPNASHCSNAVAPPPPDRRLTAAPNGTPFRSLVGGSEAQTHRFLIEAWPGRLIWNLTVVGWTGAHSPRSPGCRTLPAIFLAGFRRN